MTRRVAKWLGRYATASALLVAVGCTDEPSSSSVSATDATGSSSASAAASSGGGEGAATGAGGSASGGAGGAGGAEPQLVDCSPASGTLPLLQLVPVVSGLDKPLLAKSSKLDTSRLYIVEQTGRVRVVKDGVLLPTPFLDVTPLVLFSGEGGLLGLAFHPNYEENGRFFVHYTAQPGSDSVVAEYHRSTDPDVADPDPVAVVLAHDQLNYTHNGGSLEFGHDGMLYISFGDGATYGDEANQGQDTSTLAGKILRIDVSALPYAIPAGNLSTPGARPEIWDWGFRNPWKITFDACTGDLYIGDVGYVLWEEISVEPKGQGLKNYGWRLKEGLVCAAPPDNCDPMNVTTDPVIVYPNPGDAAVVAGYVYRGAMIPALRGTFFYADYSSGRVWSFVYLDGQATTQLEHTDDLGSAGMLVTSLGQDAVGEVYVVDGLGGAVYRIAPE